MIVAGGAAVVAILVALGFGVQAFASANAANAAALTTATNSYCAQYESALAGKLNTSTSTLEQANKAAAQAVLNQMVKDGKITAAQETQIENQLQAANYQLCPGFGGPHGFGGHGGPGGPMAGVFTSTLHATIEKDVAAKLGISTTTLESDLANGQTVAQIASAQKVSLSAVESVYLADVQNALKSDTSLASTQATDIYTKIKSAADSGHYVLLGPPHGPRGAMGTPGAWGNPPANTSTPASN